MRRLIAALALAVGSFGVTAVQDATPVQAATCKAWASGTAGYGYCTGSRPQYRVAVACRKGSSISYRYGAWLTWGAVSTRSCLSGWYASSAFIQTR